MEILVCGIYIIIGGDVGPTSILKVIPFCFHILIKFSQIYHVVLRGPDQVHHVRPLHAVGERRRHCHGCHWRSQLRQAANQQLSRQKYLLGDFLCYKENISRIFTAD